MKLADKTKIYQKLVSGLSKGVQLAALLGEQGHTAKQAEVLAKNEVLAAEAAKIRKKIQKQWGIQAAATTQKIQAVNSKLQDQIRDIDHSIATAEKVVKAVGIVDDLVDLAKKVAAAIA